MAGSRIAPVLAVIGAGYGDEGKGLFTDYLARKHSRFQGTKVPLVMRGNGGAQAGHTVVDGMRRHVFGHIGSGTMAGARTYLAENFIVNPMAFAPELEKVKALGMDPTVYAHSNCRVTTIFDMALNSLAELFRGRALHGSCGYGINETVTRNEAGYYLTMADIRAGTAVLATKLEDILREYVPTRLYAIGYQEWDRASATPQVRAQADVYLKTVMIEQDDRAAHCSALASRMQKDIHHIHLYDPKSFTWSGEPIIYEGAQGLLLDEYHGAFPHVTRSVTGVASAVRAAAEAGRTQVQPYYITRCYTTRHGAGPLYKEGEIITDGARSLPDETNMPNQHQGTLRFAPLNLGHLKNAIKQDMERARHVGQVFNVEVLQPKLVVTHLDQLGRNVQFAGWSYLVESEAAAKAIGNFLEVPVSHVSYGPEAKDVRESTSEL